MEIVFDESEINFDAESGVELKQNIIYFNSDHSNTPKCSGQLAKAMDLSWTLVTTWGEMAEELQVDNALLAIHVDMMTRGPVQSVREFMDALATITKFKQHGNNLKVGVVITNTTPRSVINDLQQTQCQGILLHMDSYSESEVNQAMKALAAGIPYWPGDILDQLPSGVDTTKKTILFYQPDRYLRPDARQADAHFEQHIPCNFLVALTWEDFVAKLDLNPDLVGFHCDMFNNEAFKISELINTFRDTLQIKNKTAKICVSVNGQTTQGDIADLKKSGIAGIQIARSHGGMDLATKSWCELLNTDSYWPAEVIAQLPVKEEPLTSIYFRGDADTYMTADMVKGLKKNAICRVQFCSNWDQLDSALQQQPHQLVFYIGMLTRLDMSVTEIIESLKTRMRLSHVDVPIGVGIEPSTPTSVIKELKRAGVFGIVPSAVHWGTEATVTALNSLAQREPHWPKHILDALPGAKKKTANADAITLTSRQDQVFKLIIQRGSSNKAIAKTLGISESTVKLHLTEIFKKYGVRNRTQLAVFSHVI